MTDASVRTVSQYLRSLDPERRRILSAVRKVVNDNLPEGYAEGITYGVIAWHIPLATFPGTYNGQPLCCAALAANKNYNTLHLMGAYGDSKQKAFLRDEFEKRGKKFDMGQACLRFRTLDDLPLDVIGAVIQRTPAKALIAWHEAAHGNKTGRSQSRRSTKRRTLSRRSAKRGGGSARRTG